MYILRFLFFLYIPLNKLHWIDCPLFGKRVPNLNLLVLPSIDWHEDDFLYSILCYSCCLFLTNSNFSKMIIIFHITWQFCTWFNVHGIYPELSSVFWLYLRKSAFKSLQSFFLDVFTLRCIL